MKKFFAAFMCVVFVLVSLPTYTVATGSVHAGMTYTAENGEITITGYTEDLPAMPEIPEEIEGKPVTAIAEFAFRDSQIESIAISKTVTSIGDGAFFGCDKLTGFDVAWNNEVYDWELSSILRTKDRKTVIASIQNYGGAGNVTDCVIEHIGYGAYANHTFKMLNIPDIKAISDYAFMNNTAESFHFASATEIKEGAFMDSAIDKAYFGAVESIGSKAFYNCKGELYFYCNAPEVAADAFGGENVPEIYYAKGTTGWETVTGATELEPVKHTMSFIQNFEGIGLASDFFASIEIFEGLSLTTAQIPEMPKVEGFEARPNNLNREPMFRSSTCSIYYANVRPCTVTFVDGVTEEVITTATVNRFSDVTEFPTPPEHEGYTFFGWSHDGTEILDDMTIIAQYDGIFFWVTFVDSLASPDDDPITVKHVFYGTDVEFPEPPTHLGYTFTGWDKDGKNILENTTITALYEKDSILGDVTGDGRLNTGDAVMILRQCAGLVTFTEEQKELADFNKDGRINTGDAVAVLRYCAGLGA